MRLISMMAVLLLMLAACTAGSDDSGATLLSAEAPVTTAAAMEDADAEFAGGAADRLVIGGDLEVSFETVEDRQVIRNASLQLQASDTRAAFEEIVRLAESAGGFVASANVFPFQGDEDAQPDVALTLRIPEEELSATMDAIKDSVDEVVSESQTAQDVTEQFVDLEAQLRNLEALEIELRALLTEVREQPNADPQKLLTVFNELSSVRGQIEQIQGRLNVLSDLTALATVHISIGQTPEVAPIVEQPWEPVQAARTALSSLVSALQDAADWGINLALFVLPMLVLTVGPPAFIGYLVYRRFFKKGDEPAGPTTPTPAES